MPSYFKLIFLTTTLTFLTFFFLLNEFEQIIELSSYAYTPIPKEYLPTPKPIKIHGSKQTINEVIKKSFRAYYIYGKNGKEFRSGWESPFLNQTDNLENLTEKDASGILPLGDLWHLNIYKISRKQFNSGGKQESNSKEDFSSFKNEENEFSIHSIRIDGLFVRLSPGWESNNPFKTFWESRFKDLIKGRIFFHTFSKTHFAIHYRTCVEESNHKLNCKYRLRIYSIGETKKVSFLGDFDLETDRPYQSIALTEKFIFFKSNDDLLLFRTFIMPSIGKKGEEEKERDNSRVLLKGPDGPIRNRKGLPSKGILIPFNSNKNPINNAENFISSLEFISDGGVKKIDFSKIEMKEKQWRINESVLSTVKTKNELYGSPFTAINFDVVMAQSENGKLVCILYENLLFIMENDKNAKLGRFKIKNKNGKYSKISISDDKKFIALKARNKNYITVLNNRVAYSVYEIFEIRIPEKFKNLKVIDIKLTSSKQSNKINPFVTELGKEKTFLVILYERGVVSLHSIGDLKKKEFPSFFSAKMNFTLFQTLLVLVTISSFYGVYYLLTFFGWSFRLRRIRRENGENRNVNNGGQRAEN